jgi:hypothetical protein
MWRPAVLSLAILLIVSLIFFLLYYVLIGRDWPLHHHGSFGASRKEPDATVLISTLVLVYTFFGAAYGFLIPLVLGKENIRLRWNLIKKGDLALIRFWALLLIILAIVWDLFRIANSLGDLYATTMGHFPPSEVYDSVAEFMIYLSANAAVLAFVLIIVSLPSDPDRPRR